MNKIDLIKKEFGNIELDEENYEYNFMISSVNPEMYINYYGEKIIDAHLHHIISDMREEGWYLLACKGELHGDVNGIFLFQRAKEQH